MIALILASFIGAMSVVDGDTLAHQGERLRIWGIDAAEMSTPEGKEAAKFLDSVISGKPLTCVDPKGAKIPSRDRYGRPVVQCFLPDGRDLGCLMVGAGHAKDWPQYSDGFYRRCAPGWPR